MVDARDEETDRLLRPSELLIQLPLRRARPQSRELSPLTPGVSLLA